MTIKKTEHKAEHRAETKPKRESHGDHVPFPLVPFDRDVVKAAPANPATPPRPVPPEKQNPGPIPPESSWREVQEKALRDKRENENKQVEWLKSEQVEWLKSRDKPDSEQPLKHAIEQGSGGRTTHERFLSFEDKGHLLANALEHECSTHEGRKAFYAGDGVARATALRDQALALAARFNVFIRA